MKLEQLNNKKIAILGFGKEGQSSLAFLKKIGIGDLTVLDKNTTIEREEGVNYVLGEEYIDNLDKFDIIFKTPGITPYQEKLKNHKDKLITQAQVFFDNYDGKVIGITGTKGKSTTSTLAYTTLQNANYDVKLVGNIGNPVLDEVDILGGENHDYIIYELSSYMLEGLKPKLEVGLLNNIYNCHLDWHDGRDNYDTAKLNVLRYAKNKIVNSELDRYKDINSLENIVFFGDNGDFTYKNKSFISGETTLFLDENIALKGEHNRKNITGIIAILSAISDSNEALFSSLIESLKATLESFEGLPHRIQNIGTYNDITFIDDAIATTPESTIAAINTFGKDIGTIFLGGADSGFKFEKLRNTLETSGIENIVLFPDTGLKVFGDFSNKLEFDIETKLEGFGDYHPNIIKLNSMEKAVEFAYKKTPKGKICLLSCAAPSFSLWSGYIEKGEKFKQEVLKQK